MSWTIAENQNDNSEALAKAWRDSELVATDYIVPLADHPQRDDYIEYRTALRDWPSTESFPDTRPVLGE
jgi:hypothetical protein